jgi:hypothetical protein
MAQEEKRILISLLLDKHWLTRALFKGSKNDLRRLMAVVHLGHFLPLTTFNYIDMKLFKQKACTTLILLFAAGSIGAQSTDSTQIKRTVAESEIVYYGFGLGLDYGGLGVKMECIPIKNVGFFIGFGYNFAPIGWNAGFNYRINPGHKVVCKLMAMYGYNGVLQVVENGRNTETEVSYGLTAGIGIDIQLVKKGHIFSIELLVPSRSSKFMNEYDRLKNDPNITTEGNLLPIAVSLGYNFKL